jgi:hypothetical protein
VTGAIKPNEKGREKMDFVKTVEDLKDKDGNVTHANVEVFTAPAAAFEPSEALSAAIAAGSVSTSVRTVEVPVKDGDKVTKVYRQDYTRCTAKSKSGALALPGVNGDESRIWDFVSQRSDAVDYQPVYVALKNIAAGPAAALKKFEKLTASLSPEQLAAVKAALAGM